MSEWFEVDKFVPKDPKDGLTPGGWVLVSNVEVNGDLDNTFAATAHRWQLESGASIFASQNSSFVHPMRVVKVQHNRDVVKEVRPVAV
jgi:hypothetical protein